MASGALFYLGMSARSEATQANEDNSNAIRKVNSLKAGKPFPDADNKKMVKDKVAGFAADTYAFQQELLKFRPEGMPRVSPGDFNKKVGDYVRLLKAYYTEKKIALPESTAFGLEAYVGPLADKDATRELEYERKALDWLFKSLADANPTSLVNVHRQQIAAEKNAGSKSSNKRSTRSNKVDSVYQAMPVELTFTGSEASLKTFLTTIGEAKEYFFAVRVMRLQNESAESPDLSLAKFAEQVAAGGDDFFGGLDSEGEGDSAPTVDEKILKKVVGDEKLVVYLKLDLLLFKEAKEVKIPGYKPAKPETTQIKK